MIRCEVDAEVLAARLGRACSMLVQSAPGDVRLQVECDVCGGLVVCERPQRCRRAREMTYECRCGQRVRVLWSRPERAGKRRPRTRLSRSAQVLRRLEWLAVVRDYLELRGPTTAGELGEVVSDYFAHARSARVNVRMALHRAEWAEVVSRKPLRFGIREDAHEETRRGGEWPGSAGGGMIR